MSHSEGPSCHNAHIQVCKTLKHVLAGLRVRLKPGLEGREGRTPWGSTAGVRCVHHNSNSKHHTTRISSGGNLGVAVQGIIEPQQTASTGHHLAGETASPTRHLNRNLQKTEIRIVGSSAVGEGSDCNCRIVCTKSPPPPPHHLCPPLPPRPHLSPDCPRLVCALCLKGQRFVPRSSASHLRNDHGCKGKRREQPSAPF